MKLISLLTALLWLVTSTFSIAGAASIVVGQENCHEMEKAAMSMHHEDMKHDESAKSNHEQTSSDECDEDCCDGGCLCTAYCSSITAMTPAILKVKTTSLALTTFKSPEQGLLDPPLYSLDPPPRSVV